MRIFYWSKSEQREKAENLKFEIWFTDDHVRDYSALSDFRLIFCDKWQMIEQ